MFPQVKQLRQADGAEGEEREEGKVKCLRTCGKKWDKERGEKEEKGGSREKCHRHEKKFCGRSSICPGLLKRRSKGRKEGSGTDGDGGAKEAR